MMGAMYKFPAFEVYEVYRTAIFLIDTYGSSARQFADRRADKLLAQGDATGSFIWRTFGEAVDELTRPPRAGETVH
jgi:hypothetical protein